MSKQTKNRKYKVLNDDTYEDLKKYLGFRHFSRHSYAFDLSWELMKDLILRISEIKKNTLNNIREFIKRYL